MKKHNLVEIEAILVHETGSHPDEGGFLIKTADKEEWLPKCAVEKSPHPNGKHDWYIFDVPEYLAEKKGLI